MIRGYSDIHTMEVMRMELLVLSPGSVSSVAVDLRHKKHWRATVALNTGRTWKSEDISRAAFALHVAPTIEIDCGALLMCRIAAVRSVLNGYCNIASLSVTPCLLTLI